jgi:hypothetical protein
MGNGRRASAVCQNLRLPNTGLGGEIGRRAGLKIPFRKECRFDSDPRHQMSRDLAASMGFARGQGERALHNT